MLAAWQQQDKSYEIKTIYGKQSSIYLPDRKTGKYTIVITSVQQTNFMRLSNSCINVRWRKLFCLRIRDALLPIIGNSGLAVSLSEIYSA